MNDPLHKQVFVRCSPAHAFTTFTQRIDAWWPPSHRKHDDSRMELDARDGGHFIEYASDGQTTIFGEVVECLPPKRIVYTWNPGRGAGPTTVTVSFHPEGEGTRVEVLHVEGDSQLGEQWRERVAIFDRAWTSVLRAFQLSTGS